MAAPSAIPVQVKRFKESSIEDVPDIVAAEEPLEIRLGFGPESQREQKSLAVTMRTPGNDLELSLGFLLSEGIIQSFDDVTHIEHCMDKDGERSENIVRVEVKPSITLDWEMLQRNFYTNSSCGICGKASIESLESMCPAKVNTDIQVSPEVIHNLGTTMREAQMVFEHTGGLHAAGLFDPKGELLYMREDIGRHNAVDKIVGASAFKNMLPMSQNILMLSGRSCFELIQKAVVGGIPIVVAVGAPSSLAVETAKEYGVTLIGFAKDNKFNIYAHKERIA